MSKSYAPMDWSEFYDRREMIHDQIPLYIAGDSGPIIFCLHGAGLSALSFAALAREMKTDTTLISFDFRGHGASLMQMDDMAEATLIQDALNVLKHVSFEMEEF